MVSSTGHSCPGDGHGHAEESSGYQRQTQTEGYPNSGHNHNASGEKEQVALLGIAHQSSLDGHDSRMAWSANIFTIDAGTR